jgi:hypothetical protein
LYGHHSVAKVAEIVRVTVLWPLLLSIGCQVPKYIGVAGVTVTCMLSTC